MMTPASAQPKPPQSAPCYCSDLTTLRIGIKDSARYIGGINLFGKNSGDTEQDINVQVSYKTQ